MEFVPFVAMLAFAVKLGSFYKFLTNRDLNAILTQVSVWASGILAIVLLANTDFASGINIGDKVLSTVNGPGLILIGLSIGSAGSLVYDIKRSFDVSDTSREPRLLPGPKDTPVL